LKRPTLALAVAINRSVREHDEWFDEPDDLDRVERAIAAIETMNDPVEAGGTCLSTHEGPGIHRRQQAHGAAPRPVGPGPE